MIARVRVVTQFRLHTKHTKHTNKRRLNKVSPADQRPPQNSIPLVLFFFFLLLLFFFLLFLFFFVFFLQLLPEIRPGLPFGTSALARSFASVRY